ncbi:hypothetical protein [Flavobacterium nackdongense]|uniref:Uncharacterized protein n=1 Tax=Flavobacterium nackdongense TaxID=2547394 RepID=A0A4V1AGV6_9FLAO|nr:hypothetical protein [Flavobacterium nackdongense]QBN19372.1 hypothetical protein E1750_11385 [Flavobacterium nackdongense]
MKTKLTFLLFISFISLMKAQINEGEITLSKNVTLEWITEKFNPEKHKIETCETGFGGKFICKIDNEIWLGSDTGMENPRNQLKKLILTINSKSVELDIKNMFNPSFDGGLSMNQFLLKKEGVFYRLYGFFSDGAGTYTVHWRILGKSSIREVISNDETYFSWQNKRIKNN